MHTNGQRAPQTDLDLFLGAAWGHMGDIPTHLLLNELRRRDNVEDETPACGSKGNKGTYNTSGHVFALFLILTLSTAGE
jgi:hypothetical protein